MNTSIQLRRSLTCFKVALTVVLGLFGNSGFSMLLFLSHNDHSAHLLVSEGSAVLLSLVSSNGNNFVHGNHAVSGQFLKSKRSVESEPPWTPKWMLADAMMI